MTNELSNYRTNALQSFAEQFVASTRRYLFVRPQDGVLILRPNKVHHLNWQHRTPKASG